METTIRKTRILATLGPASSDETMIRALLEAGVDMFRLNFSHGKPEDHAARVATIRKLEVELGRPVAILADLQGPKLRIGTLEGGRLALSPDMTIRFDLSPEPGNASRIPLPHPEIFAALEEGSLIFLDDGKVRARITRKGNDFVEAQVKAGSELTDRKGLNVPGAVIPIPALTRKDLADLEVALSLHVDWVAQSFVQTPEDVAQARELIAGRAALMVKLEKPSAIARLEEIIPLCDGAMLARGDLGVEIPPEKVPATQKRVVRMLREAGKPVVVATQMLESMITNARPTRAEASDVATAVYDGADAVMLSAETASGAYPVRAVEMMDKICRYTEADETYGEMMDTAHPGTLDSPADAITTAAYYIAEDIGAACIVTYTMSGSTALRMARQRPGVPILCLTPDLNVARRLCVSYGVVAAHDPETPADFSTSDAHAAEMAKARGLILPGQRFVMTAGVPFGIPGTTNLLRIGEG